MTPEEKKAKIEELESKIKILQWDKDKNQLNPGKVSYLENLKKEVDALKNGVEEKAEEKPEEPAEEKVDEVESFINEDAPAEEAKSEKPIEEKPEEKEEEVDEIESFLNEPAEIKIENNADDDLKDE